MTQKDIDKFLDVFEAGYTLSAMLAIADEDVSDITVRHARKLGEIMLHMVTVERRDIGKIKIGEVLKKLKPNLN